jgi:hypothetical protein
MLHGLVQVVGVLVAVGGGDCPAEADEVARDGGRDDRAAFAALGVQPAPELV